MNASSQSDVPLETFFGPEVKAQSPEMEQRGRTVMYHFHHVVEPLLLSHQQQQQQQHDASISKPRIPRTIHVIWLGPSEKPAECVDSWGQFHPDWEVRVWTNADIEQHAWHNRDVLQHAISQEQYGMASDVLRLEILWKYGGLYVDCDYMCVARVDDLHASLDFYCGASCTRQVEINNGLLACRPQHPLISAMMNDIYSWWNDRQTAFAQVAAFLGGDASGLAVATQISAKDILNRTGPGLITRTLGCYLMIHGNDEEARYNAVLPFSWFHPMPNTERSNREGWQMYVRPHETRAVHLWGMLLADR
jgi:hypothetical protein